MSQCISGSVMKYCSNDAPGVCKFFFFLSTHFVLIWVYNLKNRVIYNGLNERDREIEKEREEKRGKDLHTHTYIYIYIYIYII